MVAHLERVQYDLIHEVEIHTHLLDRVLPFLFRIQKNYEVAQWIVRICIFL
jgi:hypothetical protein